MIRALLIVAGLSSLDPSCGLDGGDDGGAADTGPAQTVGTQCTAVITEFCTQAAGRCDLPDSIGDCVTSAMPQCCSAGNTCDETSASSQSDVDSCKADIDTIDCNFIANAALPDSCQPLLHP